MISVFIQFGGGEAENVGLCFRQYLLDHKLDPFFAGRNSRDIPAGIRDYWGYIRDKIRTSDVMVSICCEEFEGYCGVKKEFLFIDDQDIDLISIPFIKNGSPTPKYYENAWHPFYFDVESCEENFCDLLVEIYRRVYIKLVEFESRARACVGGEVHFLQQPMEVSGFPVSKNLEYVVVVWIHFGFKELKGI